MSVVASSVLVVEAVRGASNEQQLEDGSERFQLLQARPPILQSLRNYTPWLVDPS
jgi:hypothetical protein